MDFGTYKDTTNVLEALQQVQNDSMPVNTKGKSFDELAELMEETKTPEIITESVSTEKMLELLIAESIEAVDTSYKNSLLTLSYIIKENYEVDSEISGELLTKIKSIFNRELIK